MHFRHSGPDPESHLAKIIKIPFCNKNVIVSRTAPKNNRLLARPSSNDAPGEDGSSKNNLPSSDQASSEDGDQLFFERLAFRALA
jgi:hypothetical protein